MRKTIRTIIMASMFLFFIASPVMAVTSPVVSNVSAGCEDRFLGIPPWYRGLTQGPDCDIKSPDASQDGLSKFIWKIVLNVVEMALVAIVYVAVFFILYGGFLYMVGGNKPELIERGKKTLLQAVIGLVVGLGSVAVLNLVFNGLFGSTGTTSSNGINGLVNMSGDELFVNALNLAYFVAGVVSVVTIIIGGILYTISSGDSGRLTKAKNTIVYAIVGLIIVLLAFTITGFVTGRFTS